MPTHTPARTAPILIGGIPSNISLPEGSRATHVDSDLHSIAARLREIDPNYTLTLLEHVNGEAVWVLSEQDRQGVESLVFRIGPGCEIDALDARVLEKVNYLRFVPADERLRKLEAEIAREREKRVEDGKDKMWEELGAPMYSQLARLGFISAPRSESMRPLNATARRHGRR